MKIPKTFMGKPIAGAMERVLSGTNISPAPAEENTNYEIPANEKRNYIHVPQFGIVIATRETHLGKNMFDTLEALAGEKLKMPSQRQFMRHWLNIREAAEGTRTLLYADITPVGNDVAKDLWDYMSSSTNRGKFNGKVCWTWLNSLFEEENGRWFVEEDLKVLSDAQGNKYLQGTRLSLDPYIEEDCYVGLNFNSQNLPTTKSSVQDYSQGNNIYFRHPLDGKVAWFDADSVGALLSCGGDPAVAYSSLGVFPCAEGANAKNLGGNKK